MKKFLVLGVVAMLLGCVSTGSGKVARELAPVGVIAVTSNDLISWYGEKKESAGLLGNLIVKKVSEVAGENVKDLVALAEASLLEKLAGAGIVALKPQEILQSAAYMRASEDSALRLAGILSAPGYKYLTIQNKALAAELASALGMKTGIYAYFEFTKLLTTGLANNGVACAAVTLNVGMVDEKGKLLSQKSYLGKSKDTFPVVAGIYKPESLMKLYPEAIGNACEKFIAAIKK